MNIYQPESQLDLADWIESSADRLREDGAPVVTGAPLNRAPTGLGTLPRTCVSTTHLADVVDFRPKDLTITVGAGMRVSALARIVDEEGLWLPLADAQDDRSIGGWIAAAPVSEFDSSFGPVRRHFLACTLLLWDGRATTWGRPVLKNVAGYEVTKLICGSRARLGIATTVTLRLWPRPRMYRQFDLTDESLRDVEAAMSGMPRLESALWRASAGVTDPPSMTVSIVGGPGSVAARAERLEAWARDRRVEIREREREGTKSGNGQAERLARPGTSAAYRVTFGRRYLTAGLKDVSRRLARELDPWTVEMYPAIGVVRVLTERQKAAGQRHAPAWLTTLAEAGGRAGATGPPLDAPSVRIERGGQAEHDAARRMRSGASRDIESRWLAAFGGLQVPWQADYL